MSTPRPIPKPFKSRHVSATRKDPGAGQFSHTDIYFLGEDYPAVRYSFAPPLAASTTKDHKSSEAQASAITGTGAKAAEATLIGAQTAAIPPAGPVAGAGTAPLAGAIALGAPVAPPISGGYGSVRPAFRVKEHGQTPTDAKLTFAIPDVVAVKELDMTVQTEGAVIQEAEHAADAEPTAWSAHNVGQAKQSKTVICSEWIPDKLFSDLTFNTQSELFEACLKVSIAIKTYHDSGKIHCDIKGTNVFVGLLIAKLVDFGLSRLVNTPIKNLAGINYMAPEARNTSIPATAALDCFSAGVMFVWNMGIASVMKFAWNTYLLKRFNFMCNQMQAPQPEQRPSFEKVIGELKALVAHARFLEDEKQLAVDSYPAEFPDISAFLEFELALSSKRRIEFVKAMGDRFNLLLTKESKTGLAADMKVTSNAKQDLIAYLQAADPKEVVKDMQTLLNVMQFYPRSTYSAFLTKIGLATVQSLIKTKEDYAKLKAMLERETMGLCYDRSSVKDFLQGIENFLKKLPTFHTVMGVGEVSGGVVRAKWESGMVGTEFVKTDVETMMQTVATSLKVGADEKQASTTTNSKEVEDLRRAAILIEDSLELKGYFPFRLMPSIELRIRTLCGRMKSTDRAVQPNVKEAKDIFVGIVVTAYILENQYYLSSKHFDEDHAWRNLLGPIGITCLHDLVDADLDLDPGKRHEFLRCMNKEHFFGLIKTFLQQYPSFASALDFQSGFILKYLNSNSPFQRYIVDRNRLECIILFYQRERRLCFLEKVGIDYLRTAILKTQDHLNAILNRLPEVDRPAFAKHFNFKPVLAPLPTAPIMVFSQLPAQQLPGAAEIPPAGVANKPVPSK